MAQIDIPMVEVVVQELFDREALRLARKVADLTRRDLDVREIDLHAGHVPC